MGRYTNPRDVYFGAGAISELSVLKGRKKAVIVTGGASMRRIGALEKLQKVLEDSGIETALYEGIEPDPSVETVEKGAKFLEKENPDVIAAIGGGSAIDAAKAMWVMYEHPGLTFEEIVKPFALPPMRGKAIFAAIPSTSGTASEVTAFSVITDRKTNIKYPLADFGMTPDIAVLDTDLPVSMPFDLCANTGLDALTHSIEAYVASARSPFTDAMALESIVIIFENLLESCNGDRSAREMMHIAQCMAGMAFSSALLGIAHSLAHKTGAMFSIPHGMCNAILLPHVIEFNEKEAEARYAVIARRLGLAGGTDRLLVKNLISEIIKLRTLADVPSSYKEAGVSEELFIREKENIVKNAIQDPCTGCNPRSITESEMLSLLERAYYGK
ncbi:MAG: iron-containing alcohol dehydrogenase [Eubacteriales bacterium]|nr:iron-containing alcohol dehydrogenase [Eubacteriales bacterium]MDD3883082.1 iron-containing alcohol dehydrogenase [Eubacteriales bacterium]MDD4512607.1 iron-containing alcohol dehydrogenase [Eubacteriales bacterium]